jgi:outer membrane protein insertion porin family
MITATYSSLVLMLTAVWATAETQIRITGTTRKSESQVLGLMGGRLEHVRTHDASPSRADDAAFLLRQVLRKDGYSTAEVDWKIVRRNEILLSVREGERLSLGKVTLRGVPTDETQKLVKLYSRPAEKDRPLASGDAPFREGDVETGLSYLRQELNAQGHWSAEATLADRETDESGSVNVVIDVALGPLYRIGKPRIASTDDRGESEAEGAAAPFIGKAATTGNLNAMRVAVEEAFTSSGYPDSKITMGRELEGSRFTPDFTIDLGKRVLLNKVHIEGLEITNPRRIEARMKTLEGDWYDEAAMNKRIRGFLATGAFSSARIETQEVADERIDATLHFDEGRAKQVSLAVGADSYQGGIFRATYADRNLWGNLMGFSTGLEFSARGVLGETKLTDPWLFGTDVMGMARLYALIYSREGYSSFESGLDAKTTWKFGDHYTLDFLAGYSIVNTSVDGLPTAALGETVYTHPRLRLTHQFDFRDSAVLPTRGWHLMAPLELGAAVGELSTAYLSTGMTGGWYHKINNTYQLGLGGEWGVLVPSGDGQDLPIDLRLFNGGSRSVRSFPERELGPTVDGYAVGGEAMWNANAELIRTLSGSVKGVVFFDAGSLARDFSSVGSSEIEMAVGLGIRLDLPIGPVRFEYGYNLTKDPGEPVGTFHFAIGAAF